MPSRCLAAVKCHAVVLLMLGGALAAHAQTPQTQPDGTAAVDSAISDAVKGGESPYRPMPRQTAPGAQQQTFEDAECQALMRQMNETPKRSYRPSDTPVENSQGADVLAVERDRTRRQLQKTFKEKCGS